MSSKESQNKQLLFLYTYQLITIYNKAVSFLWSWNWNKRAKECWLEILSLFRRHQINAINTFCGPSWIFLMLNRVVQMITTVLENGKNIVVICNAYLQSPSSALAVGIMYNFETLLYLPQSNSQLVPHRFKMSRIIIIFFQLNIIHVSLRLPEGLCL
jgi:hypothetical protein